MTTFEPWTGRGRYYLNTAAYGLPPAAAIAAAQAWTEQWASGTAPFAHWLPATDRAREIFAQLIHVPTSTVATGTSVSQLTALVAASLPEGALVIADETEFGSLLFPFLAAQARGVRVELVPRRRLAETIAERGDVVLFSLVSSADGVLADHEAIWSAAASRGALTVVDAAQACGWLDLDYSRFDVVVCPAFKWLGAPRGTAFLVVKQALLGELVPYGAGWWSAGRAYARRLDQPTTAKHLDTSPVWNAWGATEAALSTLRSIGVKRVGDHVLDLANRFRAGLGRPPGDTPIVVIEGVTVPANLTTAGFAVSQTPAGGARLSFGPCNDRYDVDHALEVVHG